MTRDSDQSPSGAGSTQRGWYVEADGAFVGPLDRAALAQRWSAGELTITTLVWAQGFAGWLPLGDVPELVDIWRAPRDAQVRGPQSFATAQWAPAKAPGINTLFRREAEPPSPRTSSEPGLGPPEFPALSAAEASGWRGQLVNLQRVTMTGLNKAWRALHDAQRHSRRMTVVAVVASLCAVAAGGALALVVTRRPAAAMHAAGAGTAAGATRAGATEMTSSGAMGASAGAPVAATSGDPAGAVGAATGAVGTTDAAAGATGGGAAAPGATGGGAAAAGATGGGGGAGATAKAGTSAIAGVTSAGAGAGAGATNGGTSATAGAISGRAAAGAASPSPNAAPAAPESAAAQRASGSAASTSRPATGEARAAPAESDAEDDEAPATDEGASTALDKAEMVAATKAQVGTLGPCIKEARRVGELQPQRYTFVLDWVIQADGTVSSPSLAGPPEVLGTALRPCFEAAIARWHYRASPRPTRVSNFPLAVTVP